MYSVLEGVDEVVESFSQSFSPFRLPVEGQEENPPAESGLHTAAYMPTNDGQNKNMERRRQGDKQMKIHTHIHTDMLKKQKTNKVR